MSGYIDTRTFTAIDEQGREIDVIAEREVVLALESFERTGQWQYRTNDNRIVKSGRDYGRYEIEEDGTILKTTDPREPKD